MLFFKRFFFSSEPKGRHFRSSRHADVRRQQIRRRRRPVLRRRRNPDQGSNLINHFRRNFTAEEK